MLFKDLKLDFKVDEERELIFVFVNPVEEDHENIIKQLDETHKIFVKKYANKIDQLAVDSSIYYDFDQDLLNLDIVPRTSVGEVKLKKPNFWQRLIQKITQKKRKK